MSERTGLGGFGEAWELRITYDPYGSTSRAKHGVFHGTLANAPVHGVWRKFMVDISLGGKGL